MIEHCARPLFDYHMGYSKTGGSSACYRLRNQVNLVKLQTQMIDGINTKLNTLKYRDRFYQVKVLGKKMGDQDARNYEYLLIIELDETVNTLLSVTGEVLGDISQCLMCPYLIRVSTDTYLAGRCCSPNPS